ncbi:CPY1 Carboxypeptidase Y [Candida maltosa Xu316]
MKLSTLVKCLVAITGSVEAAAFGGNQFKDQIVFSAEDNLADISLGSMFRELGSLPQELIKTWSQMQSELTPGQIASLLRQYETKNQKPENNKFNQVSAMSSSTFEALSNNKFSDYTLRVKENAPEILGLDTVKQYTGYLDIETLDKHLFYWFFESRNDPKNDPIILWLNGGPGCSSSTGLFFELGPSSINKTLHPVYNPHSWNSNASVIFLDQPVGVGYSYTGGEEVRNTVTAAKDVYKFPQFLKNKFHIAGESYAGHYIPAFASEIINNADRSFELSSVLIGNGITDPLIQEASYKPMGCGEGGYFPVLTPEQCDQMEKDYPKCASLTKLCYKFQTALTCVPAQYYCDSRLFQPYAQTGLNPYDIRKDCADQGGNCYVEMDYMDDYLNLDYVKKAVGASNIDIYTSCDDTVFRNFILDGDEMKPFQQYVAELLEHDIPVLIYAGDKDYICNWLGNLAWVNELDYSDGEVFSKLPLQPWRPKGKTIAGEVKNYKHFTFLRVFDAGHMVPYDQPENALSMVNTWIQGDYTFGAK